ncbi:MAG: hypothetical protein LBC27_06215 [Spirochaetaceae bacterium]|jgi:hypothetical protein|nr:hypothetical protein [Spirochaetaceae bacterium]
MPVPFVIVFVVLTIGFMICIGFAILYLHDGEYSDAVELLFGSLGCIALAALILATNFFFIPSKENRFVPDTKIVASLNGTDTANLYSLEVGEPFYLQIRISVESRSFARRLFGDDEIPFVIEISNPDIANFVIQKSEGIKEIKPPEKSPDNNFYYLYLTAFADQKPREALINLKGIAKKTGEQRIKLTFSEKVSGKYSKIDTLVYMEDERNLYDVSDDDAD